MILNPEVLPARMSRFVAFAIAAMFGVALMAASVWVATTSTPRMHAHPAPIERRSRSEGWAVCAYEGRR